MLRRSGLLAHSTALLADSLDMLGDALVYGFSLAVLGREARWQARAALLQGGLMAVFGLGVIAEVVVKTPRGVVPTAEIIDGVGSWRSWPRPDTLIGALIAGVFGASAFGVLREATRQLRLGRPQAPLSGLSSAGGPASESGQPRTAA